MVTNEQQLVKETCSSRRMFKQEVSHLQTVWRKSRTRPVPDWAM